MVKHTLFTNIQHAQTPRKENRQSTIENRQSKIEREYKSENNRWVLDVRGNRQVVLCVDRQPEVAEGGDVLARDL
jgi:hypothetical protein